MYRASELGQGIHREIERLGLKEKLISNLHTDPHCFLLLSMGAMLAPLRHAERSYVFEWWMGLTTDGSGRSHLSKARKMWRSLRWPLLLDDTIITQEEVKKSLKIQLCADEKQREHALFALWILMAAPRFQSQWVEFAAEWGAKSLTAIAFGYGSPHGMSSTVSPPIPSPLKPTSRAVEWSALALCESTQPLEVLRILPYLRAARHLTSYGPLLMNPGFLQGLIRETQLGLERLTQQNQAPFDIQFVWDTASCVGGAGILGIISGEQIWDELAQRNSVGPALSSVVRFSALRGKDLQTGTETLARTLRDSHKSGSHNPIRSQNLDIHLEHLLSSSSLHPQNVLWRRAAALAIRWIDNPQVATKLGELALMDEAPTVRLSGLSSLRERGQSGDASVLRKALLRPLIRRQRSTEVIQVMLHAYTQLEPELAIPLCGQIAAQFRGHVEIRGRALSAEATLRRSRGESFISIASDMLVRLPHQETAINVANILTASAGFPPGGWNVSQLSGGLFQTVLRPPLWYGIANA